MPTVLQLIEVSYTVKIYFKNKLKKCKSPQRFYLKYIFEERGWDIFKSLTDSIAGDTTIQELYYRVADCVAVTSDISGETM